MLNLLYPPKCIFCGRRLEPGNKTGTCPECANTLPFCRKYVRCRRCGKPIADSAGGFCEGCSVRRNYAKGITSAFVYIDNAKSAVIALKKEYNAFYAKTLSLYVAEMIKYDFGGLEFDFAVSAPPRKKNYNEENFDHAACLAREVALRMGIPYKKGVLYQTEKLRKQSDLHHDERLLNVKGKFAVRHPDTVRGKTILVIDDVYTTGATIEECAAELRRAGAYRVYAATAATTVKQNSRKHQMFDKKLSM